MKIDIHSKLRTCIVLLIMVSISQLPNIHRFTKQSCQTHGDINYE